jgi:phage terminase large subunit GpA-like protein
VADGFQVYTEAFARAFALPPALTISECADQYRWLPPTSASAGGRWRTSRTPYLREIMDVLSPDDPTNEVVLMKGAQLGGSEIAVNWALYTMLYAPAQFLIYQPSLESARSFNQDRIEPMMTMTPELEGIVARARSRSTSYRALYKSFLGGALRLAGANSPKSFRQISAPDMVLDDLDGWPGDVGGEGDPITLLRARASTFGRRWKMLQISTPTTKDESRIEKAYLASDQRRYLVPCPECQHPDWMRWENIRWTDSDPATARLLCANCGVLLEEGQKTRMLEQGRWVAQAPGSGKAAGFHLSALYSPLGWLSWESCVKKFLAAKDDPPQLKGFVNTVLGETYDERPDEIAPSALYARREVYPAPVPDGVGVLVRTVDTQDDCLVWQVTGFGAQGETWAIDYGQIAGDPGTLLPYRDLDRIRELRYQHQSGRQVPVEITLVDAGGHHFNEVLAYCKPRQAHRVYAIHGGRDTSRELVGKPSTKNKLRARLYTLCVNTGKDTLRSRLRVSRPSETARCPGYIHLPVAPWCDEEYCAQLTSEVRERQHVRGVGWTRKWTKIRDRNEAWDLMVYALAALDILGPATRESLGQRAAQFSVPVAGAPTTAAKNNAQVLVNTTPRARPGFVTRRRTGFGPRWGR